MENNIARRLIWKIYGLNVIQTKFKWLDEIDGILLKKGQCSINTSPNYGDGSETLKNQGPDINLYELKNVVVCTNSSAFYTPTLTYIERHQGIEQSKAKYVSGNLKRHNQSVAEIDIKVYSEINKTVLFLGGNGSFNYYHWLIEISSKLMFLSKDLINKYEIEAIVVNSMVAKIESFNDILRLYNSKFNLPIIFLDDSKNHKFKSIVFITTFNDVLYNSIDNKSTLDNVYFNETVLSEISRYAKNFIKNKTQLNLSKPYPEKIFLVRGAVSSFNKRNYNEDEILNFFKNKGFVGISPEKYSFLEQVYLFSNATHIVGPSGAFWANIIFANSNVKCISWLPSLSEQFSVYSSLAHLVGADMIFIKADNLDKELHGPYKVNINKFKELDKLYYSVC